MEVLSSLKHISGCSSVVRSAGRGDSPDKLCNDLSGIIPLVLRSSIQAVRDSLMSDPYVVLVTAD